MGTYTDLQTFSIGVLIVRLVIGLIMAAHGTQKLLGWFGGYGLRGTGEFFVQLGLQRPCFPSRAFQPNRRVTWSHWASRSDWPALMFP
jgi:uncharacterized membrane protein YphA (DoxX/SURF4 family)